MKFVSIDIETTGLNSESCQILEIGAVIEDTASMLPIENLPQYSCIIHHHSITGSIYAINLNKRIFEILAKYEDIKDPAEKLNYISEYNILTIDQVAKDF